MGSVISLYEELVNTEDDRVRMRLIAEALDRLEHRPVPDSVVTRQDLNETELRLQKEIEQIRHETEQIRSELKYDIEQLRTEVKRDIADAKAEMLKWVAGLFVLQGTAIVGAVVALV